MHRHKCLLYKLVIVHHSNKLKLSCRILQCHSSVTCPALFTPVSHVQPSSLQCHMSSPLHLFTPVSHVQPSSPIHSSVTCPALFTYSLQCHMSSPLYSSVTCPALFSSQCHMSSPLIFTRVSHGATQQYCNGKTF